MALASSRLQREMRRLITGGAALRMIGGRLMMVEAWGIPMNSGLYLSATTLFLQALQLYLVYSAVAASAAQHSTTTTRGTMTNSHEDKHER